MTTVRPISTQPLPANATCVFEGKLFSVYQWEQTLYDGSTATFEKVKRPDTVLVFATTNDRKILLLTQEQPGYNEPFVGVAGGRVEDGEDPETAALRELLEETGYTSDDMVLWKAEQPLAKIEWAMYTFIARNCRSVSDMMLDAGEKMILKPVTLDELIELGTSDGFYERNVIPDLYKAKLNPSYRKELEELFFGG